MTLVDARGGKTLPPQFSDHPARFIVLPDDRVASFGWGLGERSDWEAPLRMVA
jgi:hypothetical protein